MNISWFCQWDASEGVRPSLDEHDRQGLLALLRDCPLLIEGHVMVPVHAHDPYYASELYKSPALLLQLEFAEIADLEASLQSHGHLQTLAHPEVLPSLRGAVVSHHAMLTRRYAVAEPLTCIPPKGVLSYMMEYEGPARDESQWHQFYIANHVPLLKKFPGVRKIEIYTPACFISALPFPKRNALQRNKTVFDSPESMDVAMASPVRAALRRDFEKFPEYEGGTAHYPFWTHSVSGDLMR